MSKQTVYAKFSDVGLARAMIELGKQYLARDVLREYITNGIDGKLSDTGVNIDVIMDTKQKRVVISDDGLGMTPDIFDSLPGNVGESLLKFNNPEYAGEKGLGRLAFASIGRAMHIISRANWGDRRYSYQMWEINPKKGYEVTSDSLTQQQMENFFYGGFSHGTRVVIEGVNPHTMTSIFLRPDFKTYLKKLYAPALRKNIAQIRLGRYDKRTGELKMISVGAPSFKAENSLLTIEEEIDVPIKGNPRPGKLEIVLSVDPEATSERLMLHSKNVLVYDAATGLEEFEGNPVFGSGRITGYVNDNFNRLNLPRTAFERDTNAFKAWYHAMKSLEERLRPYVEECKSKGRKFVEDKYVSKVVDTFSKLWGRLGSMIPGSRLGRDQNGEIETVIGISPPEGAPREKEKEKVGGEERGPGPGTFVRDPDGIPQVVSPKRGIKFPRVEVDERFPLAEMSRRFRMDYNLEIPTIFINPHHSDYTSRVGARDKKVYLRYLVDIVSSGLAMYRATRLSKDGKLLGDALEILANSLSIEEEAKFLALKEFEII